MTTQFSETILQELRSVVSSISEQQYDQLAQYILSARAIFVAGAGRSGLMSRAFAMRLMHMGFQAYVVGETITPRLEREDLIILGTGSGETKGLISMAEKARSIGASIAVVTIAPDSSVGRLANICVILPAQTKTGEIHGHKSVQPMGALFEQSLLIFYDAMILKLMEKKGLDSETMFSKHANLE